MKDTTAVILLLLSIGIFYTFTSGQYQEVKNLRTLALEYKNVLDEAAAIEELRDSLLNTYSAIPKAEIERLNKVLPNTVDTVQLAFDLDGMASKYGISIRSVKTNTDITANQDFSVLPDHAPTYNKASITFSFISNYANFKQMLADVEKSLRLMDVSSISFQSQDSGLYDYQISADTYWLK
ncbi:MAG: type 4a pilus biogenesis protein PilO [Patescibacteria group bacterium]